MTAEVRVFGALSVFGVVIGVVYWFLTYDTFGTVMLILFGVASGIAGVAELVSTRAAGRRGADRLGRPEELGPASAETIGMAVGARGTTASPAADGAQPLPRPGWAPLGLALGLGGIALAAAFGPAIGFAGLLLTLWSARSWLGATVRETDDAFGSERGTASDARPPSTGR